MKKLLSLLGTITLISKTAASVISCKTNSEIIDDGSNYNGDLKILNDIAKKAATVIQEYASNSTLININNYAPNVFDALFSMVTSSEQQKELDANDSNTSSAISNLMNAFNSVFQNVNREIRNEYSNYYVDTLPLTLNDSKTKFILNYIDVANLGKLTGIDTNNLKAVRLDFKFSVLIKFKELQVNQDFLIQYTISNDTDTLEKILTALTGTFTKAIVKFFNSLGDIIVDQNSDFSSIYDNFDLNYASNHTMLDNIVQNKLSTALQNDDELGDIRNSITYAEQEEILVLLTSIINPEINGVVPVLPDVEKYTWVNTGYAPEQLTSDNFLDYFGNKLNILTSSSGEKLQLGQFKVNLAKILIAGIPLSGIALNDGQPFYINVGITREGMIKKIKNFGTIIAEFYKYFQIIWDIKHYTEGRINVSNEIYDMFYQEHDTYTYKKIWNYLLKEFKSDSAINKLPDIDKFSVSTFNVQDFTMQISTDKRSLYLWAKDKYDLRFQFGVDASVNNIYYTPWPVDKWNIAFKPYDYPA